MAGQDTAALEALKRSNESNFEALRKREDELAKSQSRMREAEKGLIKAEAKSVQARLPSRGMVVKTFLFALIVGDLLGIILDSSKPLIGITFDLIIISILSAMLKAKPYSIRSLVVFAAESVPILDYGPWYSLGVILFYFQHKETYGTLKDMMRSVKELGKGSDQGIFNGTTLNISGAGVFITIAILLIPGCVIMDLSTTEYQSSNLVSNGIKEVPGIGPVISAYKDSGRAANFIDRQTINTFNWEYNADPLGWVEDFLNRSTALAGNNYYEGEIEETRGLDLGLKVEGVQFLPYDFVGDPLEFSYYVTGGTFTESETQAIPICYLKKPRVVTDDTTIYGKPTPTDFFMTRDIPVFEFISCNIETKGLDPGFYQVFSGVEYEFEVWSYIPYTFVRQSTFSTYGQDINERLDIDRETKSLDTDGPITLTISELSQDIPQPYVIREDRDSRFAVNFKLVNKELGNLKQLDYVILQVPKEFDATCFRGDDNWEEDSDEARNILKQQIVEREKARGSDTSAKELEFLDDINVIILKNFSEKEIKNSNIEFRCALELSQNADFLDEGQKTTKTIVATAKYRYRVENVDSVELKQQPGVIA